MLSNFGQATHWLKFESSEALSCGLAPQKCILSLQRPGAETKQTSLPPVPKLPLPLPSINNLSLPPPPHTDTLTCPEALLATDGALARVHQVTKELPASGCLKEGQVKGLGHTVQGSTGGHGAGDTLQRHRVRQSDM